MTYLENVNTRLDCGHEPSAHGPYDTGYGKDQEGKTFCYDCAAELDRESLRKGQATLYFDRNSGQVTNWPGSLRIAASTFKQNKHSGGFGSQRTDAWFYFEGRRYHGINRGDNNLLRVKVVRS